MIKDKQKLTISQLGHTWILDFDGTLVVHNGYKTGEDKFLPGAKEFLQSIPAEDYILIMTAREKEARERTEKFLKQNGIRYNNILFEMPMGERILINDDRNPKTRSTVSAELGRIVHTPKGPRIILVHGSRQELDRKTNRFSSVTFDRYSVDFGAKQNKARKAEGVREKTLSELLTALDNKSEAIVQKALDNLIQNKTVFVIAHRLSTIKNADRIAVINEGELVELGNHDELMSIPNGQYKALYEMQFKKQEAAV